MSGCAAVLPIARASVRIRAQLLHVVPVSQRTAVRLVGPVSIGSGPSDSVKGHLCLVAYKGPFATNEVRGVRQLTGEYALLVLTVHHPRVVGAVLVDSLPHLD